MFYGSFGTQNLMVTLVFKFYPRKGQLQVKIGQIRSNFKKFKIFLQKYADLVQICLRIPKMSYFCVQQLEMPKNHFKNVTSPLPVFFCHCTTKNKDIALKFCMRVCMCLDHIYSVFFLITCKFRIL